MTTVCVVMVNLAPALTLMMTNHSRCLFWHLIGFSLSASIVYLLLAFGVKWPLKWRLCYVLLCVCAGSWNRSIRAINTGAGSASFLLLAFHCAIRMFSIVQCRVFLGTLQYTYSSKRTAEPSWNDQSSFSLFKKSRKEQIKPAIGSVKLRFPSIIDCARNFLRGPTLFINGPGAFFLLLFLSLPRNLFCLSTQREAITPIGGSIPPSGLP